MFLIWFSPHSSICRRMGFGLSPFVSLWREVNFLNHKIWHSPMVKGERNGCRNSRSTPNFSLDKIIGENISTQQGCGGLPKTIEKCFIASGYLNGRFSRMNLTLRYLHYASFLYRWGRLQLVCFLVPWINWALEFWKTGEWKCIALFLYAFDPPTY